MTDEEMKSGFHSLKTEFLSRVRTDSKFEDLELVFYFAESYLGVHEKGRPEQGMALAFDRSLDTGWSHYLTPGTDGLKLVGYFIDNFAVNHLAEALNEIPAIRPLIF